MDVARAVTRLPVLQELPPDRLDEVRARAYIVSLRSGELIWDRGEAASVFSFLIRGQIRLVAQQNEPRNLLIDIVDLPGTLVCVPAVCGAAPYCCHAVSGHDSELLSVPREVLIAALTPVGALLLAQSSERAMNLCRRLREVTGSKVQRRVASVLLRLADERGIPVGELVRLPATISRRDLAGLSGCATETLIRELAKLEDLGAVSRSGRTLLIDLRVLANCVYGEA